MSASSSSSRPVPPPKPYDFSSDSPPPKPSLSPDQLKYCAQALKSLRDKIQKNPGTIRQEFKHLQDNRLKKIDVMKSCRDAVMDGKLSKNRYTDVLPFDESRVILKDSNGVNDYVNASFFFQKP